jgi:hypothetical protein
MSMVPSPVNKGRRPAELLSPEEVRAHLRACSARAPTGIRNRALIAVLYRRDVAIARWRFASVPQVCARNRPQHDSSPRRRSARTGPGAHDGRG